MDIVNPGDWPKPKGYSNGVKGKGEVLFIAGQIGWNKENKIVSPDFAAQTRQALENVAAVVRAAGGQPADVARMTWYVVDKAEYLAAAQQVGEDYRSIFGKHFPAMTLVEVKSLLEPGAKVEIEATAVLS